MDLAAVPIDLTEITTRRGYTYMAEPSTIDGWYLTSYDELDGTRFVAVRPHGDEYVWHTTVREAHERPDGYPTKAAVFIAAGNLSRLEPDDARLVAELCSLAADYAAALNEAHAPLWAKAEAERLEREKREREEREQRRAEAEERRKQQLEERAKQHAVHNTWTDEMQEALQWHVGERLRLIRWGKKATVFGTLDDVVVTGPDWMGQKRGRISLTTEKGKHMVLEFRELERFQLRDEDTRAYEDMTLPDHPVDDAVDAVTRERLAARRVYSPDLYPPYDENGRRVRREIAGGSAKPITIVDGE